MININNINLLKNPGISHKDKILELIFIEILLIIIHL